MSRLVVISNRIALPNKKEEAGGLAVALQKALKTKGGVWLGWSGTISDSTELHVEKHGKVTYATMDLSRKDYQGYYIGFCNSTLWPLFHYSLDLTKFRRDTFKSYQHVNTMFAEKLVQLLEPNDTIWVHDYQLMTLGLQLRQMDVADKIGFFLHIPFPVPEVMIALPYHKQIVKGLCAYDVLGFQTESDLQAFLSYICRIAGGIVDKRPEGGYTVQAHGRTLRAYTFPISVETEELMEMAQTANTSAETKRLKISNHDHCMMIGVDRLDYTKGLMPRLEGFHYLLQNYPHYLNKVSYMQITPPSRTDVDDYRAMRMKLEAAAARINGINAEIDWVPIRYINKSFPRKTLAGFYRASRVGVVTPIRDGMNLVAKEYVACQDPQDPGVLVLSQFAGAAQELDAAVIVNPYDIESVGEAFNQALEMKLGERQERYQSMIKILKKNDIFTWTQNFLSVLEGV